MTFAGDSNYNAITIPVVENLTIHKGTLTLNTTILDSTGGPVTNVLGEQVYDTATLSGDTAGFTPTIANVDYVFVSNGGSQQAVRSRARKGRWRRAATRTR